MYKSSFRPILIFILLIVRHASCFAMYVPTKTTFLHVVEDGHLIFSPNGEYVVSLSKLENLDHYYYSPSKKVTIFSVHSGEMLATINEEFNREYIKAVTFSQDSKLLALLDIKGVVTLWDWRKSNQITMFTAEKKISSMLFHYQDRCLILGLEDGTLVVWNIMTNEKKLYKYAHGEAPILFLSSGEAKSIVSSDGHNVKIWLVFQDGELLPVTVCDLEERITTLSCCPDRSNNNRKIIIVGCENGEVNSFIWDKVEFCLVKDSVRRCYADHAIAQLIFPQNVQYCLIRDGAGFVMRWDYPYYPDWTSKVYVYGRSEDGYVYGPEHFYRGNGSGACWYKSASRLIALHDCGDSQFILGYNDGALIRFKKQENTSVDLAYLKNDIRQLSIQEQPSFKDFSLSETSVANSSDVQQKKTLFIPHVLSAGHSNAIASVAYSDDGQFLVSGSADKTVKVWDTKTGKCIRTLVGHKGKIISVDFSSDRHHVISGAEDGCVKLWNVVKGSCVETFMYFSNNPIVAVQFSPDGKHFFVAERSGNLSVWSCKTKQQVWRVLAHEGGAFTARYSPNGEMIVSSGHDDKLKVWNPQTGESIKVLESSKMPSSLRFSFDSKCLLADVSGFSAETSLWDIEKGERHKTFHYGGGSWKISSFYKDDYNEIVYSSGRKLYVVEGEKPYLVGQHAKAILNLAVHDWHVATCGEDACIKIWDTLSSGNNLVHELPGSFWWVDVFAAYKDLFATIGRESNIKLWNSKTMDCIKTFCCQEIGSFDHIYNIAFSFDGKHLFVGCSRGRVYVLDIKSGVCVQRINLDRDGYRYNAVCSIASFEEYVAVGYSSGETAVWDFSTGQLRYIIPPILTECPLDCKNVRVTTFSSDGSCIIRLTREVIEIYDAITGKKRRRFFGRLMCSLGPDCIAIADDYTINIHNYHTGEVIKRIKIDDKTFSLSALTCSSDGRYLVSGDNNGSIAIWDTATGLLQTSIPGQGVPVCSLAMVNEKTIVAVMQNGEVRAWQSLDCFLSRNNTYSSKQEKALIKKIVDHPGLSYKGLSKPERELYRRMPCIHELITTFKLMHSE